MCKEGIKANPEQYRSVPRKHMSVALMDLALSLKPEIIKNIEKKYKKHLVYVQYLDAINNGIISLKDVPKKHRDFIMCKHAIMHDGANFADVPKNVATINLFEEAIKSTELWASGRDDTLIIVTADHETGALYYDRENTSQETIAQDIKFLSYNHSRTRVTVDIYGDISEFLNKYQDKFKTLEGKPYIDNTDVFKICASYM